MVRFEMGFKLLPKRKGNIVDIQSVNELNNIIQELFDLIQVRVYEVYSKTDKVISLGALGPFLINLYANATSTVEYSRDITKQYMVPGEPLIYMELNKNENLGSELQKHLTKITRKKYGIWLNKGNPLPLVVVKKAGRFQWGKDRNKIIRITKLHADFQVIKGVVKSLNQAKRLSINMSSIEYYLEKRIPVLLEHFFKKRTIYDYFSSWRNKSRSYIYSKLYLNEQISVKTELERSINLSMHLNHLREKLDFPKISRPVITPGFEWEIHELIGIGNLREALQKLVNGIGRVDPNVKKRITIFSARLQELARKEQMGIIHVEKADIERNQISKGILDLLEEFSFNQNK